MTHLAVITIAAMTSTPTLTLKALQQESSVCSFSGKGAGTPGDPQFCREPFLLTQARRQPRQEGSPHYVTLRSLLPIHFETLSILHTWPVTLPLGPLRVSLPTSEGGCASAGEDMMAIAVLTWRRCSAGGAKGPALMDPALVGSTPMIPTASMTTSPPPRQATEW
jgi:hypothetical protein